MSRTLATSVVYKGNVYPAGTDEADIKDASKIGAAVWAGEGSTEVVRVSGDYDSHKAAELQQEIEARNSDAGRSQGDEGYLAKTGNKAELVAALEADDAARASS